MSTRSSSCRPCPVAIVLIALIPFLAPTVCPAAESTVRFYDDIKPLFAIHCHRCHGPETAKGGLRLDVRERALAKGDSGDLAIAPGHSGDSALFRRITSHDPDDVMPKKGERLSAAEVERVRAWIDQGAVWPERDDYWAFRPPTARAVPAPAGSGNAPRNPIDAFIDARLASERITVAPPADVRTLLRRAYVDLLGVPPSPEEADAFLNDRSPQAYERLIDRLLDDPRYGERWARHWLDLVRYAESDGFEDDKVRPLAWRYRDYVIRSFNADKPYDRFVREQVAGDELYPNDADALVATGFARLGMWDGMSKEPAKQRQDFLNDVTDAAGSVFLGMTVGCARCHDHKYDPITQRDYYGLQAFFAGIKRDTRELPGGANDPPHVIEARRTSQAELSQLRGAREAILREAREEIAWVRRCEVDASGQLKVSPEEVKKKAELTHPGRLGELEKGIKLREPAERLNALAAEAVLETSRDAPKTLLLKGGELSRPGAEVPPSFIEAMAPNGNSIAQVVSPKSGDGTGRRSALAMWLTSPEQPLVARVWVNRLWQHHFGRGLVATPSDFGRHGQRPSHRELLDWLACRLIADGWSTKQMHRLMMTSAAYRRSSADDRASAGADPENKLLWRMNRRRLEGEAIRDSILTVSGRLSPTAGGPGVYPRIPKDVNVQLPNNDKELSWGACTDEEDRRRTIYTFQRRSLTFPIVDVFDGAPMNQSCPTRPETTVAPQALALFNGESCREQARHLAERARNEAGEELVPRIDRVFRLALARPMAASDLLATKAFIEKQAEVYRTTGKTQEAADAAAFDDFCHVILNTNEFLYLD